MSAAKAMVVMAVMAGPASSAPIAGGAQRRAQHPGRALWAIRRDLYR